MGRLDGKVAIISGGARGQGASEVRMFAQEGAKVVFGDILDDEGMQVEAQVRELGGDVTYIHLDVRSADDWSKALAVAEEKYGKLNVLVNNAGITFGTKGIEDTSTDEWDVMMAVNVKGPFLMVQATAELLTRSRGRVVNLVDLSAFQPWVEHPHHSVSKAALLHLTRIMARALAPHVRVNAVAPGAVLLPDSYDEAKREESRQAAALGTIGSPEDIVRTILFLERSPFITGEVIVVDGGRLVGGPGPPG